MKIKAFAFTFTLCAASIALFAIHQNQKTSSATESVSVSFNENDYQISFLSESEAQGLNGTNKYITEVPPRVIEIIQKNKVFYKYFTSTHKTASCISKTNFLDKSVSLNSSNCAIVTARQSKSAWKRNYYGLYDLLVTENTLKGKKNIIAVAHGENKNEPGSNNTVNTDVTNKKCKSEYVKGDYSDCWEAYNAFVGITYSEYTKNKSAKFTDLGPIIWPAFGYKDENSTKVTYGLRHPDFIEHDGYIYVYYLDGTFSEPGYSGIKVARAPIPTDGIPKPGTFKNFYNGAFTEDSLPAEFSIKKIKKFFSVSGGQSDKILNYDFNAAPIMFSVAKVKNTNLFIGVEEMHDFTNQRMVVGLRISEDLVNWSNLIEIYETDTSNWAESDMHYPTFMNKDTLESNEIDLEEFYIQFTNTNAKAYRKKLGISMFQ